MEWNDESERLLLQHSYEPIRLRAEFLSFVCSFPGKAVSRKAVLSAMADFGGISFGVLLFGAGWNFFF